MHEHFLHIEQYFFTCMCKNYPIVPTDKFNSSHCIHMPICRFDRQIRSYVGTYFIIGINLSCTYLFLQITKSAHRSYISTYHCTYHSYPYVLMCSHKCLRKYSFGQIRLMHWRHPDPNVDDIDIGCINQKTNIGIK